MGIEVGSWQGPRHQVAVSQRIGEPKPRIGVPDRSLPAGSEDSGISSRESHNPEWMVSRRKGAESSIR